MQLTPEWVAVGVSSIALIISIWSVINSRNSSRGAEMQFIKQNFDTAKSKVEDLMVPLAKLKAKADAGTLSPEEDNERDNLLKIITAAEERVLNALEDGCDKYFKKQVCRQDFSDRYNEDIGRYVRNYPTKFTGLTSYQNLRKYYEQRHQRPKI